MSNLTMEIVVEGYGMFDGRKTWEERDVLDFVDLDDAEALAEIYAEDLRVRYGCRLTRRGRTSWNLSEPGELNLWVRALPILE